jgi:hypothetical protein
MKSSGSNEPKPDDLKLDNFVFKGTEQPSGDERFIESFFTQLITGILQNEESRKRDEMSYKVSYKGLGYIAFISELFFGGAKAHIEVDKTTLFASFILYTSKLQFSPSAAVTVAIIDDFLSGEAGFARSMQKQYFPNAGSSGPGSMDWVVFRKEINETIAHILALHKEDIKDMIQKGLNTEDPEKIEEKVKLVVAKQNELHKEAYKSKKYLNSRESEACFKKSLADSAAHPLTEEDIENRYGLYGLQQKNPFFKLNGRGKIISTINTVKMQETNDNETAVLKK